MYISTLNNAPEIPKLLKSAQKQTLNWPFWKQPEGISPCVLGTSEAKPTYQETIFQPHKLFGTHVLVNRVIVGNDTLAVCCGLANRLAPLVSNSTVITYLDRALGRGPGKLLNWTSPCRHV